MKWYRRHVLSVEALAAVTLAGAVGAWLRLADKGKVVDQLLSGNRAAAYGALASVFGALMGFAIATIAIIVSFSQDERMVIVRESKHYRTLWAIFTSAVRFLGLATVLPVIAWS